MCGLAGILKRQGELPTNTPAHLQAMGRQIAHRGPDDTQIIQEPAFGAIFNRLSIVDVEGGQQPLFNEDRSLVLMVNGEIYNNDALRHRLKDHHVFQTKSDCEIILHLYEEQGPDCLSHLNGMFAMMVWDKNRQQLILARDRLGIKPLYYTCNQDRLLFGSEIKALLAHPDCPRQFDWEAALTCQTHHPNLHGQLTSFFKDIRYLHGGHLLIANLPDNTVTVRPYWTPPQLTPEQYAADRRSDAEIIAGYGDILSDAVKLRLMADVEVGLFLSGGIDSISVAAYMAEHEKYHTFSVLSQSTFQNGDVRAGHLAAKHLDLPNHQVLFSWHDNPFTPDHWKQLLWLCETPLCDAEQLYKYHLHRFAKHLRPNLKVMLLGQGSDEFNGGYGTTIINSQYPDLPEDEKNWDVFMSIMSDMEHHYWARHHHGNIATYSDILTKDFLADYCGRNAYDHAWQYHQAGYIHGLQMYNLWHEDRTASGNSIENRVPFLDHRLVEYAMRIPPQKYEAMFWDKRILRQAMTPLLPPELTERPKVPFFHGKDVRYTDRMMFDMLIADDHALIQEAFGDERGSAHAVVDCQALEKFTDSITENPEYTGMDLLLSIINMGLLAKMAKDVRPASHDEPPTLSEIVIDDWDARKDDLALQLAIRERSADFDKPLAFMPDVCLLKIDNDSEESRVSYISVDDQIKYELSEDEMKDWLAVLRRIDGRRSLRDILLMLSLSASSVQKYLEEALDYEILCFRDED